MKLQRKCPGAIMFARVTRFSGGGGKPTMIPKSLGASRLGASGAACCGALSAGRVIGSSNLLLVEA
ncbi:hypothetical protein [Parvibaculum sp.]|uniref:hypothetical protein n=1 Tax=Parvibaculum sp. TaxID=2024848 RepID=UPI0025E4B794|nr:hypothetical protein [Parvibaculum sp.]